MAQPLWHELQHTDCMQPVLRLLGVKLLHLHTFRPARHVQALLSDNMQMQRLFPWADHTVPYLDIVENLLANVVVRQ